MDVEGWVEARVPAEVRHLDAAAAGRVSEAALAAEAAHLRREAETGSYVAELEAEELLGPGRAALAGHLGLGADDVAFTDSGATAFAVLLAAWPLEAGARVGTVPGEYGGNARVLARLARDRGWELVELPVDRLGRITDVPGDLDLVTFPQVLSQRGVVQPVEQVQATGVPVLLDVAQSLGQAPVPAGCAAYVGTSRKWLCGPRGIGFLVADPALEPRLADPPTLAPTFHGGVRRLEQHEAHVAGRVGLAVAVQEWAPALLPVVHRLAAAARARLDGVAGWRVVEPVDAPTGITTLVPPAGADPVDVRARLLRAGVLVSAVPQVRAADLDGPLLRVSTHAWVEEQDLEVLAEELVAAGR